jgi:hypothetical protein
MWLVGFVDSMNRDDSKVITCNYKWICNCVVEILIVMHVTTCQNEDIV